LPFSQSSKSQLSPDQRRKLALNVSRSYLLLDYQLRWSSDDGMLTISECLTRLLYHVWGESARLYGYDHNFIECEGS
jgi:hypothetical protein